MCGGALSLAERAQTLADKGDMRLACHLADFALEASPGDPAVQARVAAIYEQRAAGGNQPDDDQYLQLGGGLRKSGTPPMRKGALFSPQ